MFITAWKTRGVQAANTRELRNELKANGLNLGADGAIESLKDFVLNPLERAGSIINTTGTVVIVLGSVFLVFAGLLIWRLATPESVGIIGGTAARVYTRKM